MPKVWKIAPGIGASEWELCRERQCIVLGWRTLRDYRNFGNSNKGKKAIVRDLGGGPGDGSGAATSILRFAYEVMPADVVVANRGRSLVVGIGLVKSDYLSPSSPKNPTGGKGKYPHARLVDWIIDRKIDLGSMFFAQSTLTSLTPDRVNRIFRAYVKRYPQFEHTLHDLFSGVLMDDRESIETGYNVDAVRKQFEQIGAFDPTSVEDARKRTLLSIVQRQGRPAFRKRLLAAYHGRCAITGCRIEALLEAAHIIPYKGQNTNHLGNGILLRADLHTLFDLHWIAIDDLTMRVLVSSKLNGSEYERYRGKAIRIPRQSGRRPSSDALKYHRMLYEGGVRSKRA